jgi:hypothetical protein
MSRRQLLWAKDSLKVDVMAIEKVLIVADLILISKPDSMVFHHIADMTSILKELEWTTQWHPLTSAVG